LGKIHVCIYTARATTSFAPATPPFNWLGYAKQEIVEVEQDAERKRQPPPGNNLPRQRLSPHSRRRESTA